MCRRVAIVYAKAFDLEGVGGGEREGKPGQHEVCLFVCLERAPARIPTLRRPGGKKESLNRMPVFPPKSDNLSCFMRSYYQNRKTED